MTAILEPEEGKSQQNSRKRMKGLYFTVGEILSEAPGGACLVVDGRCEIEGDVRHDEESLEELLCTQCTID